MKRRQKDLTARLSRNTQRGFLFHGSACFNKTSINYRTIKGEDEWMTDLEGSREREKQMKVKEKKKKSRRNQ